MFALTLVLALAAPAAELDDTLDELGRLQPAVHLVHRLEEPVSFTDGPLTLRFESGWIVPVFAGREARTEDSGKRDLALERLQLAAEGADKHLVGFTWVGEGTATMYFARPGEALRFANTQVRGFGADPEAMAAVARRDAPYVTSTKQGFVLGDVPGLFDLIWPEGAPDPDEILVYSNSAEARRAADRASTVLMQRVRVYDAYFGDFQRELGWRRLAEELGDGDHTVFTDVLTDTRFGVVDPPNTTGTPGDRWLGTMSAASDSTYVQLVQSLGVKHDQTGLGGRVHTGGLRPTVDPEDGTAPPVRPMALGAGKAHVDLYVQRDLGASGLVVEARSTLEVRAVGGDIGWIDLDVGEMRSESFEITRLTDAAGVPLAWSRRRTFEGGPDVDRGAVDRVADVVSRRQNMPQVQTDPGFENQVSDEAMSSIESMGVAANLSGIMVEEPVEVSDVRRRSSLRVVLPEVLPEGETVTLDFWWTDLWALRQSETCLNLGSTLLDDVPLRASGQGTGMRMLLPALPGMRANDAFDVSVRLHLPDDDPLQAVLPGEVTGVGNDDDWRFEDHRLGEARDPRVAFGRWSEIDRPAQEAMPALEVRLRKGSERAARSTPNELKRVFGYFGGVMPAHPFETVRVVEAPPRCDVSLQWPTSHETIELYQAVVADALPVSLGPFAMQNQQSPRALEPALESHRLAAAVARGWWFHDAAPASAEDAWLNHALTWGMACMYVGATHGPAACDIRLNGSRRQVESLEASREAHPLTLPDNGARFRRESLGPYVLFHMLRLRVGNAAFFDALREMLQEHPGEEITTDRLRTYLERTSGRSLADFFDFWVEGGMVPRFELSWTEGSYGKLSGVITSDVPYGTVDVPVVVRRTGGLDDVIWVDVVNGEGRFEVGAGEPIKKVLLDPDDLTLARRGKVKKVDAPQ